MRRLAIALGACSVAALLAVGLAGCSGSRTRPAAAVYVVTRGDTLYSISWRHGLDYRELARWNGIGSEYRIEIGEHLRLTAPSQPPAGPRPPSIAAKPALAPSASPPPAFVWPADATTSERVVQPLGGVGLAILGRQGDEIRAAAAGRVVYVGSGLAAYGRLVIVKHDDTWLSAYGCNREVYVAEGERVNAGQRIAAMGEGAGHRAQLYFEIRSGGRPVDPAIALPRR